MSRADNRHHVERAKQRVKGWLKHVWREAESQLNERRVGIKARTPKTCSCWACAGRRDQEGPTIGERRALQCNKEND